MKLLIITDGSDRRLQWRGSSMEIAEADVVVSLGLGKPPHIIKDRNGDAEVEVR